MSANACPKVTGSSPASQDDPDSAAATGALPGHATPSKAAKTQAIAAGRPRRMARRPRPDISAWGRRSKLGVSTNPDITKKTNTAKLPSARIPKRPSEAGRNAKV